MSFLTITELTDLGGTLPPGGEPAEFRWTANERNIPFKPWSFGLRQRTVRTDYPGSDTVSEQVLGPNYKPFTLSGIWRDKFNPNPPTTPLEQFRTLGPQLQAAETGGYAQQTMEDFIAMVRRGNPVAIAYASDRGDLKFTGIITDLDIDYETPWRIGYSFTVSPHTRNKDARLSLSPLEGTGRDPAILAQESKERTANMKALQADASLDTAVGGTVNAEVEEDLNELTNLNDALTSVVDQRVLEPEQDEKLNLRRATVAADQTITRSSSIKDSASTRSADDTLMYRTAISELTFETWNRGLAYESRLNIEKNWEIRQELVRREEPDAIALYRPFKGESLYSVSERFYNTPFNWRIIKERNRLPSSNLTGTELLVIPKAPVR